MNAIAPCCEYRTLLQNPIQLFTEAVEIEPVQCLSHGNHISALIRYRKSFGNGYNTNKLFIVLTCACILLKLLSAGIGHKDPVEILQQTPGSLTVSGCTIDYQPRPDTLLPKKFE